jgi:hypothetical protein
MGPAAPFPWVKLPKLEADNSPSSTAKVSNACSCTSTPPYNFMARSRANFYLFCSVVPSATVNSFFIPSSASILTIFSDAMKMLVPQNTRQTIMFSNKAITIDTVF